jgi:hypothetical protein
LFIVGLQVDAKINGKTSLEIQIFMPMAEMQPERLAIALFFV